MHLVDWAFSEAGEDEAFDQLTDFARCDTVAG
jgi:hypothetical protein